MEKNSVNNKSNSGLIVIIVILLFMLFLLGGGVLLYLAKDNIIGGTLNKQIQNSEKETPTYYGISETRNPIKLLEKENAKLSSRLSILENKITDSMIAKDAELKELKNKVTALENNNIEIRKEFSLFQNGKVGKNIIALNKLAILQAFMIVKNSFNEKLSEIFFVSRDKLAEKLETMKDKEFTDIAKSLRGITRIILYDKLKSNFYKNCFIKNEQSNISNTKSSNTGFVADMKNYLSSLVKIRKTGDNHQGDDHLSILARSEILVKQRKIKEAVIQLRAAGDCNNWIIEAEEFISAEETIKNTGLVINSYIMN